MTKKSNRVRNNYMIFNEGIVMFGQNTKALEDFKETLLRLITNAHTIEKDNRHTTYELFATLAKLDHILFKVNAYKGVFSNQEIELSNHQNCRFGKWYAGEGKELFTTIDNMMQEAKQ